MIRVSDFESFRAEARKLLAARVPPERVFFEDGREGQPALLALAGENSSGGEVMAQGAAVRVPAELMEVAERVACYRDAERWGLLYRVTWRVVFENRNLLDIASDPDVSRLSRMDAAIARDIHKMHAFVRFRRLEAEDGERYVAYYRPHHLVVRLGAPFFAERFASLRFSILTPDESAHWDGEELTYSPGVPASEAPKGDELEELFRAYYRSTYNPARARLRAMKAEMPVRHWSTLPETLAIRDLVLEGEGRVAAMFQEQKDVKGPRRGRAARTTK